MYVHIVQKFGYPVHSIIISIIVIPNIRTSMCFSIAVFTITLRWNDVLHMYNANVHVFNQIGIPVLYTCIHMCHCLLACIQPYVTGHLEMCRKLVEKVLS